MGRVSVQTGNGNFTLDVYEVGTDAAGNWSDIECSLYLEERVSSPYSWAGGGITATIGHHNVQEWWSGTFGFDFRPGGLQWVLIARVTQRVYHNADGTGQITVGANMGSTGSSAVPGPASVTNTLVLTTLKVVPPVPVGVVATRVSDTQATLQWSQPAASNGNPDSNQVFQSVNGSAFTRVLDINATSATALAVAPNQKLQYKVEGWNPAGFSGQSVASAPIYTTPAAPTAAVANKKSNLDIEVTFTENVDYAEHTHEVWHGVVAGGVTTWDGAALVTLASGVTTYTHAAPNAAQVHIYRVRARAGALASGYSTTAAVQLLIAPNKPTVNAPSAFADRTVPPTFSWVHNPQDTTPQTAYELRYSTNGGVTWTSSDKVVSVASQRTIATTFPANTVLQVQVRTWGAATSGGSEGTGASPWSDTATQTYKSLPVATVVSPTNAQVVNDATLRTTLGFAQAEAATFVKAQLELLQGATLLETLESVNLVGITLATAGQNATVYTLRARVQDSNGLWSAWVTRNFSVTYLAPVPAGVALSYAQSSGYGQIDLTFPAPGAGQSAATLVTITRTIDGVTETVVQDYPVSATLTFLDTTPTIHGTNVYTITTRSALGAQTEVTQNLVTTECRRAFLSKGSNLSTVVVFGANLEVNEALSVASATVQAAGRTKPIGLYGVETSVQLKVKSFVFAREGFSTLDELRAILLVPGKACYRDSTGRRFFGTVKGSVKYEKVDRGTLEFTMTETS